MAERADPKAQAASPLVAEGADFVEGECFRCRRESEDEITKALETSADTVSRTCRALVEEGVDAAPTR